NHFRNEPNIQFKEATKNTRISGNDMPHFYNTIDLLLVTGVNEGIPNPAMEAYACGIPILGTNIGVIKECALPNAKHLLLNSNNPRELISKNNTLQSKKFPQTLKKQIRKNMADHWTIEQNINDRLETLCNTG